MQVLIVTRSADRRTVERVERALAARGARARRFDTDRFPLEERVRVALASERCEVELGGPGGALSLDTVDAVWVRQFDPAAGLPGSLDRHLRHAAMLESRAVLFGVLESLEAFCLDPLACVRRAESKELQTRLARGLGLDVPRTLITNDPEAARAFVASCPAGAVAKMLEPPRLPGNEPGADGPAGVLHTSALDAALLERLDDLRFSPMVFQERLAKERELRVTVVGRRTFAAELDSAAIPGAELDWRRVPERVMPAWRACALEADVERRLHALLDRLGLQYGACDLVRTPEGRLVFLEVNPGGQYGWLEEHAGLPISDALAELLCEPGARREAPPPPALRPRGASRARS